MKTYLAEPCGYCQGVQRAIALAISFKKNNQQLKCYSLGALVHNEKVISDLNNLGIEQIISKENKEDILKKMPDGSGLIFSAHGHDNKLDKIALSKKMIILDTTCPMVENNIEKIKKALEEKHQVIFIGKKNHPETEAILSLNKEIYLYETIKDNLKNYVKDFSPYVITQTTYSFIEVEEIFNALKKIFPRGTYNNSVCFETKIRQDSIFKLPQDVDAVFIVGGENSSNTKRLYEISKKHFATLKIFHIKNEKDIDKKTLIGCSTCAIIAGASTNRIDAIKIKHSLEDIW